ncbi:MAG: aminomethyl-transferring glycine dehydrogenase subunit GcvPA [Thermoprotei archaeon]
MSPHPWIPNSANETKKRMLKKIGVNSVAELFSDIPRDVLLGPDKWDKLEIGLGKPLSEIEARRYVENLLNKNRVFNPPPFMGGGVYPHYVPEVVKYIITRGEFLTAYTPYQAEISQGLMQALFEYQSLMAELLDMDVVNASMYDGASALAEALLMSMRVNRGRKKVIIPRTTNPFYKEVVKTYLEPHNAIIVEVDYEKETGLVNIEELKKLVDNNTAAVFIQNPNFLGLIEENAREIGEIAHDKNALFIIGVDPISLGLLKPPGELGADIAIGEGQGLGIGMSFGGPYLGIFAVKYDMKLIRQMPGRIIGLTTTIDTNERAFAMILQTREQHIRREKATSNICTNEALTAIAAAVYLSLLGKKGIVELSELIYYRAHYAYELFKRNGYRVELFNADFFKEFPVNFDNTGLKYEEIHKKLLEKGVHGGLYIREWYPELGETALYAFTELHSAEDIEYLINLLNEITGKG